MLLSNFNKLKYFSVNLYSVNQHEFLNIAKTFSYMGLTATLIIIHRYSSANELICIQFGLNWWSEFAFATL